MRGSAAKLGANDSVPESGDGGNLASSRTVAPDAASTEQPQLPDRDMGANKTAWQSGQVPDVLAGGTAQEQTDSSAAGANYTDINPEPENAAVTNNSGLEDTEPTTGISPDPELMNNSTPPVGRVSSLDSDASSAAEDAPSIGLQDMSEEPVMPEGGPALESIGAEGEDPPAILSARGEGETMPEEQNEPMQQGGDSGVTESALSDTSEDDILHLPRQGTMPEPPEEVEDSTVTAAAEIPLQVDEQDPAEEGVEGSMQLDPSKEEDDGGTSREAPAAARRERVPLIGKVLGKIRWPEEGPSRPRGSTEEVQRTGGVGASERGATGSGMAGGLTGPTSEQGRVTETTDSSAALEKESKEEVPVSEVVEDSDEEASDRRTEATDSPIVPEEEGESVSQAVDRDGGVDTASEDSNRTGDDSGTDTSEDMHPGHREADASASVEHMKDEL